MANYGRLIGADEEGTLLRFKAHLRELIDPTIKEHHGRIVKTTGDGALVEFVSVVDAVRCAVKIQREMVERNADSPEDKRTCRFLCRRWPRLSDCHQIDGGETGI